MSRHEISHELDLLGRHISYVNEPIICNMYSCVSCAYVLIKVHVENVWNFEVDFFLSAFES